MNLDQTNAIYSFLISLIVIKSCKMFCHQKPSPFGSYRLEIHIHMSQRRGFSIESCCLEAHMGQKLGQNCAKPGTLSLSYKRCVICDLKHPLKKTPPKHTWKRTEKLKTGVICRRDSTESGLPSSAAASDVETFTERKPRSSKLKRSLFTVASC